MPWLTGLLNLAMLLGLAYLGYKLAWVPLFATINAVLTEVPKVLRQQAAARASGGKPVSAREVDRVPLWPLATAYLLWGYGLARLTGAGVLLVGQAVPLPAWSYQALASLLLTLYIIADRLNMLKYAEARNHPALRAVYLRLGRLIAGLGAYGLLHLWLWPSFGGRGWSFPLLGWGQQLLSIRGAGIALGVVGLLYLVRLAFRIIFIWQRRGTGAKRTGL
jgi:hypothetical protein